MRFRLVPKSVTLNDLNGVMVVTLRYFTEFGKHAFQHITASICGGIYARVYLLYFVVRVRCRRKESSRSLSHLLISFFVSQYTRLRDTALWCPPIGAAYRDNEPNEPDVHLGLIGKRLVDFLLVLIELFPRCYG